MFREFLESLVQIAAVKDKDEGTTLEMKVVNSSLCGAV